MQPSEIQVGLTYQCYGGWIRRVIKIDSRGMVKYVSWLESKPDRICHPTSGHIVWFSRVAETIVPEESARSVGMQPRRAEAEGGSVGPALTNGHRGDAA